MKRIAGYAAGAIALAMLLSVGAVVMTAEAGPPPPCPNQAGRC